MEKKQIQAVIDWNEVYRTREIIFEALINVNLRVADVITALCLCSIEQAHKVEIDKSEFLEHLSNCWDDMASLEQGLDDGK